MSANDEARILRRLFDGRRDIFGIGKGRIERADEGKVFPEPMWDALYTAHLKGEPNADLGIYLVRDDDTVTYALVDIDEPNYALAEEVADAMPSEHVWIERSRSGNYHVLTFFDEPLEAWAARAVLRGVVVAVGQPALEIFPKQDGIMRKGMVGNYVSIPWHGQERPVIDPDGDPWPRGEWLTVADSNRTSAEQWRRRGRALGGRPRTEQRDSEFGTRRSLHICANHIFEHRHDNPLVPGHRATVLFALSKMYANCAVYDEAETVRFVQAVNEAGSDPIPEREVRRFVRNAFEGGFTSTGCDDPLVAPYASPDCKIANG